MMYYWGLILLFGIGIGSMNFYQKTDEVKLAFRVEQSPTVYEESIYGEPPQLAIWLENTDTKVVKTVYVTKKSGTGRFEGKMEVPVALPIWYTIFQIENKTNGFPSPSNPVPDAITGPTQKDLIAREIIVERGRRWRYFIEVNVAGDFNEAFPNYRSDGEMDPHGNGQPSIIYSGEIFSIPGSRSSPELVGRSEQFFLTNTILTTLEGITSARKLLPRIEVFCVPK